MKKELTIKDRVDILMREGTENPKKWATVHGYSEPDGMQDSYDVRWYEEWERLRVHHLEETYFLFDVIKELRARLLEKENAD
jgi:hypothetical protein